MGDQARGPRVLSEAAHLAVLGVLTWWFLGGLVAWSLVGAAGRPAQVAVVLLGWLAGMLAVRNERTSRASPDAPDRAPRPRAVRQVPRHGDSGSTPCAAPAPDHPSADQLRELERRAAVLRALVDPGVEVVILLAHQADLVALRRSALGVDLELDAHRASYVLRTGAGDVTRTNTGGQQTMSVLVPERLLDSPDGDRFVVAVEAWQAAGVLVDVEWEVEISGAILYVQVRHDDEVVQLGNVT